MIDLEDAADLTAAYRNAQMNSIKGVFFGKNKLQELLDAEGSMGIRCYFGLTSESKLTLVLVSADEDGNDLTELSILDNGIGCPYVCSQTNDLNS